VRPDGRLATLDAEWDGWAGWRPACVVWCPLAKGQRLLVKALPPEHLLSGSPSKFDTDSSKLQPYLLGAWQEVWVDPNAWAFGPVPVSHFVSVRYVADCTQAAPPKKSPVSSLPPLSHVP
jgi:hypothetical protein